MKINEAREVIYDHFETEWSGLAEYTYENEEFDPPTDTSWVRLAVRNRDGGQETLGATGNRRFLRRGAVMVQVFTPTDQGTFEADTIATEVLDMFEQTNVDGVRFRDGVIRELPADGGLYRNNVEIEFEYEETK
jgi:hypothetical protein